MSARPDLAREITLSVGGVPGLLPVLGELFEGVGALGSSPRTIGAWLGRAGIGRRHRVLDLACGKGAGAIAAARMCGCRVVGYDAFEPFVDASRIAAHRAGVGARCEFRCADVSRVPRACAGRFDASMMIGLYPFDRAAPILRRAVRSGGVYLLDDCLSAERGGGKPRGSRAPTPLDAVRFIESLGDRVERVQVLSPSQVHRAGHRLLATLAKNASRMAREQPEYREMLRRFIRDQRAANRLLSGPFRPVLLLVRKV